MKKQTSFRKDRKSSVKSSTKGRDDMVSNTTRKDYYVTGAYELTPHPNKRLVSVLGQPVMNRKFKYSILETSLTASSATSATPISLININQGTTDITRTGDRIRVKRLWISGRVQGGAAATGPATSRVLIVLWNPVGNASSNAPIASQVVQHSQFYGPYGSYSRDFGDSYQVVYDAVISTQPPAATSEVDHFHLDRAMTVDVEFTAGATTPTTNNLYLFHLTDTGANFPNVFWSSTVWFEDLDA